MPRDTRFLLGYGERLTTRVPPPSGGRPSEAPYDFETALARLSPRVRAAAGTLENLPDLACPDGEAVGIVTMHPQAIAKSYSPQRLLSEYGLRQVGSRPTVVKPDAWTKKAEPEESLTTELYVAGDRDAFLDWASDLETGGPRRESTQEALKRLEDVRAPQPAERIRLPEADLKQERSHLLLEVVLHARDTTADEYIVRGFAQYAHALGVDADVERRIFAGGLCFLPVELEGETLDELAKFAFLRTARPVPQLRAVTPIERSTPLPGVPAAPLPSDLPVDEDLRIAVFDGGLTHPSPLAQWATLHESPDLTHPVDGLQGHGHDVTSSLLFGSIIPGVPAPRPYAHVDHHRVLDAKSGANPLELYDVLARIQAVLESQRYEFFNVSLGPACPVEDDEIHPWTAVFDEHLADGHAIATLAIGNTGGSIDPVEARIQVPADCVNAMSIGAADSLKAGWARAEYSSVGPGRSPGVVKPDAVDFGGSVTEPFMVVDANTAPGVAWTQGTSFAAPSALRRAAGIRAHFGARLSPLAIKALLLHTARPGDHDRKDVGWGRLEHDIADIVTCSDGTVRVVYQGELTPSHYTRASIPLPAEELSGMLTIKATLTYATAVDPQDPGNYTRSGIDITFRPHSAKFAKEDAVDPKPQSFFKRSEFDPELRLRTDAHKWETVLQRERRFQAKSLREPVFDLHYNARTGGAPAVQAEKIRYALVIDVTSSRMSDLYDRVLRTYAGRLEAFRPVIDVPVQVSAS